MKATSVRVAHRFDQVGLARAIRPDQHHQIGGNFDLRGVIAAEVIEREAADAGGSHGRTVRGETRG
jgi:hypothetical protein